MSRSSTLILVGILLLIVPFSGLPVAFRTTFGVVLSACVIGIALLMRTPTE